MEAQDINRMTYFQTKENVMKNQEQTNNLNNLNDPTVANVPQSQVEFDDLPMSGEQEEQVKGGSFLSFDGSFSGGVRVAAGDADDRPILTGRIPNPNDK
jgi:hypothetical protein